MRKTVSAHPELELRDLKLFCKGKNYMLRLHCVLDGSHGTAFASLVETLRPALLDMLKNTFGITNLRKIRFVLEDYEAAGEGMPVKEAVKEVQEENETDSGL